jgi:hypothetical protein
MVPIKSIGSLYTQESLEMNRSSYYIVNSHIGGALKIAQNMFDHLLVILLRFLQMLRTQIEIKGNISMSMNKLEKMWCSFFRMLAIETISVA